MFELSSAQLSIQQNARRLAQGHIAARASDIDISEEYPWDTVQKLTSARLMGMTIPKKFGGGGNSYFDAVIAIEEIAKYCGITGRIVVEGNMGAIGAIMKYGTDEQKAMAARYVLAGDKPAICITEPEAGSAATEIKTTAEKTRNGYILNGSKHWITGGGVSKLHLIFARLIDNGEDKGISGFIALLNEDAGLVIGQREHAMGLRGIPETEIHFRNLVLPFTRLLAPPRGVSKGFAALMDAYNAQRVGAGTVALGIAQGAYELAIEFVKMRHQFGRPIAEFQGLQWILAESRIALDAARLMIWQAAMSAESSATGFPEPLLAAEAKVIASETAIKVTNDALQLHGARGYGRSLPLERMARDARMFTIGGGTAQMLKNLIAGRVLNIKTPQTRDGYSAFDKKDI